MPRIEKELFKGRIARPWTIKIEQSYGCNLSCKFCPIDYLKEINQSKAFMEPEICKRVVKQAVPLKDTLRVELTLRGEPTLNPHVLENLRIMRRLAPKFQISMFTNGVLILKNKEFALDLLEAGVNILCIDCYNNTYERFKNLLSDLGETLVDFRKFSAYKRHSGGHKLRVINLVPDIQEGSVEVRKIHNNAGNVNPSYLDSLPNYPKKKLPLKKKCCRPFRELVVHHNGNVSICCHDWRAQNIMGSVLTETLEEIWYGRRHLEILQRLYAKDRTISPCDTCDYQGGYRQGFLQDPNKEKAR